MSDSPRQAVVFEMSVPFLRKEDGRLSIKRRRKAGVSHLDIGRNPVLSHPSFQGHMTNLIEVILEAEFRLNALIFVSFALTLYDHCLTFSMEVRIAGSVHTIATDIHLAL